MMQYCFPSFYWQFSPGQIDLSDLTGQCVINKEWNCQVRTSRGIKYDWSKFIRFIQPYFLELPMKGQGIMQFGPPWMNVYEKGSYQEAHHHVASGNQLSYCYYHKLPEGSGQFGFWNENFRSQCANRFTEAFAIDGLVEWIFPKLKEGDLLIFPSHMVHQVTYQSTDAKRVTVAGNVTFAKEMAVAAA